MINIISSECDEKIKNLRDFLMKDDLEGYGRQMHSIKGLTASIGLTDLSERAKKHEYAAQDKDLDFINADCDEFIQTYHDICMLLAQAVN